MRTWLKVAPVVQTKSQKDDQHHGLGRVGNRMEIRIVPESRKAGKKKTVPFGRSFWSHFGSRNLIFVVFELVLFAALGAIREGIGGKVVPKVSEKVSKRDHVEASLDC